MTTSIASHGAAYEGRFYRWRRQFGVNIPADDPFSCPICAELVDHADWCRHARERHPELAARGPYDDEAAS